MLQTYFSHLANLRPRSGILIKSQAANNHRAWETLEEAYEGSTGVGISEDSINRYNICWRSCGIWDVNLNLVSVHAGIKDCYSSVMTLYSVILDSWQFAYQDSASKTV